MVLESYTFTDATTGVRITAGYFADARNGRATLAEGCLARELLRVVEEQKSGRENFNELARRIVALEAELDAVRAAVDARLPAGDSFGPLTLAERVERAILDAAAGNEYGVPALEQRIAALEEERVVLRKVVQDLERSEGRLIRERDALTASVDAIADELGVESEWTNRTDRGEAAVEEAARLTAHAADLAEDNARLRAHEALLAATLQRVSEAGLASEAENERLRRALVRIRDQGAGQYEHGHRRMVGATGEPWQHWAAIAEQALATAAGASGACVEFLHNGGVAAARCRRCGRTRSDHVAP